MWSITSGSFSTDDDGGEEEQKIVFTGGADGGVRSWLVPSLKETGQEQGKKKDEASGCKLLFLRLTKKNTHDRLPFSPSSLPPSSPPATGASRHYQSLHHQGRPLHREAGGPLAECRRARHQFLTLGEAELILLPPQSALPRLHHILFTTTITASAFDLFALSPQPFSPAPSLPFFRIPRLRTERRSLGLYEPRTGVPHSLLSIRAG